MKKRLLFILLFFVICGLFAAVVSPVLIMGTGENSWQTKASMSQARAGLGVVAVDGKIYAIGGYTARDDYGTTGFVGTNEQYDPKTDTWITLTPMPTPRADFAIVAYQGKIYCIGGYTRTEGKIVGNTFGINEVYDTITNSWCSKSVAPFFGPAYANVVDGKIFVTHGSNLLMYDTIADLWTNITSIPHNGNGRVSTVVDSKIIFSYGYYIDDIALGRPTEIIMIYDTKANTWNNGSAPSGAYSSSLSVAGATFGVYAPQKIYFLGLKSNTVYDPVDNNWLFAKASHTRRENFGVAVVDDVLYIIGGQRHKPVLFGIFSSFKVFSTNEQYIPLGYSGSVTTHEPFLDDHVVIVLILTIGTATAGGAFFYLKKRKNKD